MKLLLLFLILAQALLISAHGSYGSGGDYGSSGGQSYGDCRLKYKQKLTKEAWYRIRDLVSRFGLKAKNAIMAEYPKLTSSWPSLTSAKLEDILCNSIKAVVSNPSNLTYMKISHWKHCESLEGHEAMMFNPYELELAKKAAGGDVVLIGLARSIDRTYFKWHQLYGTGIYSNWASGEPKPHSFYSRNDCVTMAADGKWKAASCRSFLYILCEKRPITCSASFPYTQPPPKQQPVTKAPPKKQEPPKNQEPPKKEPVAPAPAKEPESPKQPAKTDNKPTPNDDNKKNPTAGDPAAATDKKSQTRIFEMSMDLSYDLVKPKSSEFSQNFMDAVLKTIRPSLITVKGLRSGSTIIQFSLTAPTETLPVMISALKDQYENGRFTFSFAGKTVRPTRGARLEQIDDAIPEKEDDDGHRKPYYWRVFIYLIVIVSILGVLTILVFIVRWFYLKRSRTQPAESAAPAAVFWVPEEKKDSSTALGPPPEADAPPAYSDICKA